MFPSEIPNWIDGQERAATSGEMFKKLNPANCRLLCRVAKSRSDDMPGGVSR